MANYMAKGKALLTDCQEVWRAFEACEVLQERRLLAEGFKLRSAA
jgi:hypothetical protein